MREVRTFKCETTPTRDEILYGISIATENDCIVTLQWYYSYSGNYTVDIEPNDTYENVLFKLPTFYPV